MLREGPGVEAAKYFFLNDGTGSAIRGSSGCSSINNSSNSSNDRNGRTFASVPAAAHQKRRGDVDINPGERGDPASRGILTQSALPTGEATAPAEI